MNWKIWTWRIWRVKVTDTYSDVTAAGNIKRVLGLKSRWSVFAIIIGIVLAIRLPSAVRALRAAANRNETREARSGIAQDVAAYMHNPTSSLAHPETSSERQTGPSARLEKVVRGSLDKMAAANSALAMAEERFDAAGILDKAIYGGRSEIRESVERADVHIRSLELIEQRYKVITEELDAKLMSIEPANADELRTIGQYRVQCMRQAQLRDATTKEYFDCNRNYSRAVREMLSFLLSHHGRYSIQGRQFEFANPSDLREYNRLIEEVARNASRQNDVVDRMQKLLNGSVTQLSNPIGAVRERQPKP